MFHACLQSIGYFLHTLTLLNLIILIIMLEDFLHVDLDEFR